MLFGLVPLFTRPIAPPAAVPAPPLLPVADVLTRARELVRQGWCQRADRLALPDGSMEYCAREAIYVARDGNVEVDAAAVDVFKGANNIQHIPTWNDSRWRTKRQVIAAFSKAIAAAQKAGV